MAANGPSTVAAILVAGGSGQRLGADRPKAFVRIDAVTLLERAVSRFVTHPGIDSVVVVAPATHLDEATSLIRALGDSALERVVIVVGGDTRQASVAAGLAVVAPAAEFVLVHDVARPFVPASVIDAVLAALRSGAESVVPVVPIHDTVRRVDAAGALAGVVDRSTLVAVQTPQGFRRTILDAAHTQGVTVDATDDAGLVEAMGATVTSVRGADESFKITTALDLARGDALARLQSLHRPSIPGGMP